MNWPAILAPLLAPNFLVTVLVITVASLLLAFDCIDAAMWWTAVAGDTNKIKRGAPQALKVAARG